MQISAAIIDKSIYFYISANIGHDCTNNLHNNDTWDIVLTR